MGQMVKCCPEEHLFPIQHLCHHIHLKMGHVRLCKKKVWNIFVLSPSICQEIRTENEGIPDDLI